MLISGESNHLSFAANLMSSSWTVFRPACFANFAALLEINSPFSIRIVESSPAALLLTLSAPACIISLISGAFGIIVVFLLSVMITPLCLGLIY